jgi:hypothetical protein
MPFEEAERVWNYFIDAEGRLWHEGTEFDDPDVLKLFMKNMEMMPDETYRVFCQGEECRIMSEDVPYVVQDILFLPKKIDLIFPGGYSESLNPSTLFVGKSNVLYCKVRLGKFTARFNRKSYLELAKRVKFDPKKKSYHLTVDNQNYTIKGVA